MEDRLQRGIQVLDQWERFSRDNPQADFSQFGTWLQLEFERKDDQQVAQAMAQAPKEVYGSADMLDAQIGFTWGRLMRYTQIWAKRAFADTPIRSLDEFGILMYIYQEGDPKKSEVAHQSLMEQTTCFEIIKRFLRQGLIHEFQDSQDKRSRRVSLTEDTLGMVSTILRTKAELLSSLLLGHMRTDQKLSVWEIFRDLEKFHLKTLQKFPEGPIETVMREASQA